MTQSAATLEFQIALASWRKVSLLRPKLREAANRAQQHLPRKFRISFSANILLTGNAQIRQLNRDFRGIDKPTNVLSFPQFSPHQLSGLGRSGEKIELGDIALAYQYIAAEAKNDGKILTHHITHLVIHGILHLFGYDHMIGHEAETMEKMEIKIMKDLGLPNPYLPVADAR